MFGLFKKKEKPAFVCRDLVWISVAEKRDYLVRTARETGVSMIIVSFFPDDLDSLAASLESTSVAFSRGVASTGICLFLYEEIRNDRLLLTSENRTIYFFGHYPLPSVEDRCLMEISDRGFRGEAVFLIALEDPDMMKAGGERIIKLMKQLGMKEGESLEHSMISKAGRRFREKTEKKVIAERRCSSLAEWYRINLPDTPVL